MLHGQSTACCADVTHIRRRPYAGPCPARSRPGCPVPNLAEPGASRTPTGETLGLPATRLGVAGPDGRRLRALCVDWLIVLRAGGLLMIVRGDLHGDAVDRVLVVWFVVGAISVRLFGFTPGPVGARPDGGARRRPPARRLRPGAGRGLLLVLVVPALFTDSDGRGLHDRLTGTAVVRRSAVSSAAAVSALLAPHRALDAAHLRLRGQRALRHPGGPQLVPSAASSRLQRVHLLDGDVGGQLGQVPLQFGQRNLALAVADDDVVDRDIADESGGALLLLRQ